MSPQPILLAKVSVRIVASVGISDSPVHEGITLDFSFLVKRNALPLNTKVEVSVPSLTPTPREGGLLTLLHPRKCGLLRLLQLPKLLRSYLRPELLLTCLFSMINTSVPLILMTRMWIMRTKVRDDRAVGLAEAVQISSKVFPTSVQRLWQPPVMVLALHLALNLRVGARARARRASIQRRRTQLASPSPLSSPNAQSSPSPQSTPSAASGNSVCCRSLCRRRGRGNRRKTVIDNDEMYELEETVAKDLVSYKGVRRVRGGGRRAAGTLY